MAAAQQDVVSMVLSECPSSINFPEEENKVLAHWEEIKAFKQQLKLSEDKPEYTFYDGPPFATGLPHYGHILAGTIKDTVTRYATQTGHYVQRRAGWDCHGLPVEFEIDKAHNITSREQVLEMGIGNYNKLCRGIVTRYTAEWETTVTRLGRWIDFEDDYKTMNPEFMESVWWVFKTLFDKGLVYQGYKVMPYSMACGTPLSNFEAGLNYKDVEDPAVVVSFPLVGGFASAADAEQLEGCSLLAWTTTPWTLPSNLALCVNETFEYVKLKDNKTGNRYVLLEARAVQLYPQMGGKKWRSADNHTLFTVEGKVKGSQLVGLKYKPLFPFFEQDYGERAFKVVSDGYVTADGGTGIVHQAPAFGEDDYRVCLKHAVIDKGNTCPCPVDFNGCYTEQVPPYKGLNVKDADLKICEDLKSAGRLVTKEKYFHSYPFCWRSDTPLIYKAVPSWFVAVESIKDKLLANNQNTYWVPNFVKEGRFHNWLADARDWAVSRNRFWGTPLPIWANEDYSEIVAIGSIEELETKAGLPKGSVKDLHRESIDGLEIPSSKGDGSVLKRVDEVFDCWFESGSMPYAQLHYPFENKERFEKGFPANFIAEGLDQTRGWFYTLMVLSTALFDKPAFTNLIVNGMVLASDGKKMSKRLKNYPDPNEVIAAHGADALRMYLINSPVVRAEPLKFQEAGVKGVLRDVMIPWYNAFRFMVQNAARWQAGASGRVFRPSAVTETDNSLDAWIKAEVSELIAFVHKEMQAYRLYTVMPALVAFLDQLTKWYVRLNRERLKGADEDAAQGLSVLFWVLQQVTCLVSPFTPFFAEFLYQKLRVFSPAFNQPTKDQELFGSADSVHFLQLPTPEPNITPQAQAAATLLTQEMAALQTVVELGRKARDDSKVSMKKPVKSLVVVVSTSAQLSGLTKLSPIVKSELTALGVTVTDKEDEWCVYSAAPNFGSLGKKVGKQMPQVKEAVLALSNEDMALFRTSGQVTVLGFVLGREDLVVTRQFNGDKASRYSALESEDGSMVVAVDLEEDPEIVDAWFGRELTSSVMQLRKAGKLSVGDEIEVFWSESGSNTPLAKALSVPEVSEAVRAKLGGQLPFPMALLPPYVAVVASNTFTVRDGDEVTVAITRKGGVNFALSNANLLADFPHLGGTESECAGSGAVGDTLGTLLASMGSGCASKATVKVVLDGQKMDLVKGKHYFSSVAELVSSTNA